MSDNLDGYITMTAETILLGAQTHIDIRTDEIKAFDAMVPTHVLSWHRTLTWWKRLDGCIPKDPAKVVEWYLSLDDFSKPTVPGIGRYFWERPRVWGKAIEWKNCASRLAPDAKVLINAEEGSILQTWADRKKKSLEVALPGTSP